MFAKPLETDRQLPQEGENAGVLLQRAGDLLFDHSLFNGHPRFWGYITSSAAPIGTEADAVLAEAVEPECRSWALSPIASERKPKLFRWIAEMLHYPTDSGGAVGWSGGNIKSCFCFDCGTAGESRSGWARGQASGRGRFACTVREKRIPGFRKRRTTLGMGTKSIR